MIEHNPDIPSGRIRFALQALESFRATPGCLPHLGVFHVSREVNQGGPCLACLGGAAALVRYVPQDLWPEVHTQNWFQKEADFQPLYGTIIDFEISLDVVRGGYAKAYVERFFKELDPTNAPPDRPITSYHRSPARFITGLHLLADELELAGY